MRASEAQIVPCHHCTSMPYQPRCRYGGSPHGDLNQLDTITVSDVFSVTVGRVRTVTACRHIDEHLALGSQVQAQRATFCCTKPSDRQPMRGEVRSRDPVASSDEFALLMLASRVCSIREGVAQHTHDVHADG